MNAPAVYVRSNLIEVLLLENLMISSDYAALTIRCIVQCLHKPKQVDLSHGPLILNELAH